MRDLATQLAELAERGEHRDLDTVLGEIWRAQTPRPTARTLAIGKLVAATAAAIAVAGAIGLAVLAQPEPSNEVTATPPPLTGASSHPRSAADPLPDVNSAWLSHLWPVDPRASTAPKDPTDALERFFLEVLGAVPTGVEIQPNPSTGADHLWATVTSEGGAVVDLVLDRHASGSWLVTGFEKTTFLGGNNLGGDWNLGFTPQSPGSEGELLVWRDGVPERALLDATSLQEGVLQISGDYDLALLIVRNGAGQVTYVANGAGRLPHSPR